MICIDCLQSVCSVPQERAAASFLISKYAVLDEYQPVWYNDSNCRRCVVEACSLLAIGSLKIMEAFSVSLFFHRKTTRE
jgi:hypothetical protein